MMKIKYQKGVEMIRKILVMLIALILFNILFVNPTLASQGETNTQTPSAERVSLKTINCASLLDKTRITIVCDITPSVSVFTLSNPERIVIDFIDTRLALEQREFSVNLTPVMNIRVSQWQEEPPISRVTIDLDKRAEYEVIRETGMIIIDLSTKQLRMPEQPTTEPEKTVSMFVKDADIVDLLRMIAMQFQLNIIITPDVKGMITVRLSDVPLMGAIDALVRAADCNYITYETGIILVKPKGREIPGELDSRIFELDYAEATDIRDAIKRVLSTRGATEIVYRRVGSGGGSGRASALLVTDYPEVLDKVRALIAQLDQPTAQISIEAKFIETTLSAADIYGVNWALGTAVTPIIPTAGEMALPVRLGELVLGKISLDQLSASLNVIQTRGKSKLLANPSTLTLDNQTAVINMGVTIPLREEHVDPTTQIHTFTWASRFIPIGLTVTPHITSDGMINMEVEPTVEAITGWEGPPGDQRPITVKRDAKTQVTIRDGEVAVIGGLVKDEETRTLSKIPLLGDIPILGKILFTRTSITHEKSELIVFIIPHVVKP